MAKLKVTPELLASALFGQADPTVKITYVMMHDNYIILNIEGPNIPSCEEVTALFKMHKPIITVEFKALDPNLIYPGKDDTNVFPEEHAADRSGTKRR